MDQAAKDLIKRLLVQEARMRPSIEEVMAHRYFGGVEWERVECGEADPPVIDEGSEREKMMFQTDIFDEF